VESRVALRLAAVLLLCGIGLGAVGLIIEQEQGLSCTPYCAVRSGSSLAVGLLIYSAGWIVAPSGFIVMGLRREALEDSFADWSLAGISLLVFLVVFLYVHVTAA